MGDPAVGRARRTDRRATSSSWRACARAFVAYAGLNPSFRYKRWSASVIDAPLTVAAIAAGTVNCQASAVTVRIRSRECCILQSPISHRKPRTAPIASGYNGPKSSQVRPGRETPLKHRHAPCITGHARARCLMIDQPDHADNQCDRTSPQRQQNTHPHFTFTGFTRPA